MRIYLLCFLIELVVLVVFPHDALYSLLPKNFFNVLFWNKLLIFNTIKTLAAHAERLDETPRCKIGQKCIRNFAPFKSKYESSPDVLF